MFKVVEQKQRLFVAQEVEKLRFGLGGTAHAQAYRLGDGADEGLRVVEGCEVDEVDTVGKGGGGLCGTPQGQTGFADAAGAEERE